jgi:hypothetical protein
MQSFPSKGVVLAAALATAGAPFAVQAAEQPRPDAALRAGFADPPRSARPLVWWHWLNGNVTRQGIREDLAWMARTGLGGLQTFNVDLATPKVVPDPLPYMSDGWKDAFQYAASEARRLGLEFGVASSAGWSESGGPWVKPQDGMKKLVWSELELAGGQRFEGELPHPPTATGAFQDLVGGASRIGRSVTTVSDYGDVAVIAYRLGPGARPLAEPAISDAAGKPFDARPISDGLYATSATVRDALVFSYAEPQTLRALSVALVTAGGAGIRLEAEDGGGWRPIREIDAVEAPQTTISFAPVTAKRFRVVLTHPKNRPNPFGLTAPPSDAPVEVKVQDLRLFAEPRVDQFERKAGFSVATSYFALDAEGPRQAGVPVGDVIDLTSRMTADGRLDWTPPPGRWRVLRLGYSLLGTANHPAAPEATGLEVDKYDPAVVRRYIDTYLALHGAVGPGLTSIVTDSTEAWPANWTPALVTEFKRRRGYDPTPWLATLTGAVIGSEAQSDAFLYDFRRTLADLHAEAHYGTIAEAAHAHGLTVYGEALEDGRPVLGDDLAMRSHADTPMAAFWTYSADSGPRATLLGDMKGAASVAHVYGRRTVAAESLTAASKPWGFAPADLKPFIDLEFAYGVNRPAIHTSPHQPLEAAPGLSMMRIGQNFTRHETWAEMARPWVDYIARSSFLLQQGRDVADLGYFIGEERPLTQLYVDGAIKAPATHGYDFLDADMLSHQLSVVDGEFRSTGGARYRAIFLGGDSARVTLPLLRRLAQLVEAGGLVIGAAPQGSPSLHDDPAEVAALIHRLWSGAGTTRVGRGRVIATADVDEGLRLAGVAPDVEAPGVGKDLLFVHRRLPHADIYFVDSRKQAAQRLEISFRVSGKAPEIWRADTGKAEPASYRAEAGRTAVTLDLQPNEAVFVVFDKPAKAPTAVIQPRVWRTAATLDAPWRVAFEAGRGAPGSATLPVLASLAESSDAGVKYFSGTATYATSFRLPSDVRPGQPLVMDLGQVGDVAEVRVNGVAVGTAWKAPYRLDIGRAVRRGANRLEIKVADLWVNRLIGDAQPGAKKITFTTIKAYGPDTPLRPSGLMGPVTLLTPARSDRGRPQP